MTIVLEGGPMEKDGYGKDAEGILAEAIKRRNSARRTIRSSLDLASGTDRGGIPIPDWRIFAHFAEESGRIWRGFSHAWMPTPAPPGVQPGRTIVGVGRKNLVLGTLTTVEVPSGEASGGPRRRRHSPPTLPCGIFVGMCHALAREWPRIETSILEAWNISPREGDWADQRPFYRLLIDRHLGRFENLPGLIWAMPYWVLTVNKQIETDIQASIALDVRRVEPDRTAYFGDASGRSIDLVIPRRVLARFKFQRPALADEGDWGTVVVNRTRYLKNGGPFMVDNYFQGGTLDDESLKTRGYNRATEDYFQDVGGLRMHGAWAILTAAFVGTAEWCHEVVYTHQVIDPFTHRTHDIGLIRMEYDHFWGMSYGLSESVLHLVR